MRNKHSIHERRVDRAITLLELLVVIALVGVLFALTAVAVQRSREASRRLSCAQNLKQIGLALHSYASMHVVFPSNHVGLEDHGYSAFARLLPHLEHRDLFNAINFDARQYSESDPRVSPTMANRTAQRSGVALFLCPSDPNAQVGLFGGTNYRANGGIRLIQAGYEPVNYGYQGAFVIGAWLSPSDFTDGLAFTAAMSERIRGDDDPKRFSAPADMWFAERQIPPDGSEAFSLCARATPPANPPHYSRNGYSWLLAGKLETWYEHAATPNRETPDCSPIGHQDWYAHVVGVVSARSYHPNGVNCLSMDGGVRFVANSIDENAWRAFSTRARDEQFDYRF